MAGAGVAVEGAGTGRRVGSCRSPWSRISGAHHMSPAEPRGDNEVAGRSSTCPFPPHWNLGFFPQTASGLGGSDGVLCTSGHAHWGNYGQTERQKEMGSPNPARPRASFKQKVRKADLTFPGVPL